MTRPLGQAVKTPPFHGGNRGSIPLGVTIYFFYSGSIAQLGEHLPYKQRVTGSIPVVPTILLNMAQWLRWLECRPVTPEVEGSSPFWVANSIFTATL